MPGESIKSDFPRVSVLMTIYNAAQFLRQSIDSLTAQSFRDWQLIAVENGSRDASPSILTDYSDPRIVAFPFAENIGRTPALRYAFDCAVGEYIAVMDADDVSHPERLARQVEYLDRHPEVALVGSWAKYIDEAGKITSEFTPPADQGELHDCLGWRNPIVHSSAMFRRQLASDVGGYPESLVCAQDFGLILALAQHSRIAVIDEFLCLLRVLPTSMSRSRKYQVIVAREGLINFQRAARLLPLSKEARRLNRRAQATARIELGVAMFRVESVLAGLKLMSHGLVSAPSVLWTNGAVRRFLAGTKIRMRNWLAGVPKRLR